MVLAALVTPAALAAAVAVLAVGGAAFRRILVLLLARAVVAVETMVGLLEALKGLGRPTLLQILPVLAVAGRFLLNMCLRDTEVALLLLIRLLP